MASKLTILHQFLTKGGASSDPYWQSLLQSDPRSLFPKSELNKIQSMKAQLSKTRLMMSHLNEILSVTIQSKQMHQIGQGIDIKQIAQSKQLIIEQHQKGYAVESLSWRKQAQQLSTQLSKQTIDQSLLNKLKKHPNWSKYLQQNLVNAHKIPASSYELDKMHLASIIPLSQVDQVLTVGTPGRIIEERVKQQIIKDRLKRMFAGEEITEVDGDFCAKQWNNAVQSIQEYV